MALWDALETPWGPLVPSMAIPWGLLVPFGATGRAFGGQMGSSWAKPGAKCDPNLSQTASQNVTKSTAEIQSNFGVDLGTYFVPKMMNLKCLLGCIEATFCKTKYTIYFATFFDVYKMYAFLHFSNPIWKPLNASLQSVTHARNNALLHRSKLKRLVFFF